ncbi:hypothetical protein LTS18_011874, partial [Coniosporium uncinatum]
VLYFSSHYTVLTPTLRGYPPSDVPRNVTDYTREHMISDLLAILDHEQASSVVLIGHDVGGGVARFFTFAYPNRVEALFMINTPFLPLFLKLIEFDPAQQEMARYTIPYFPISL